MQHHKFDKKLVLVCVNAALISQTKLLVKNFVLNVNNKTYRKKITIMK